MSRWKKRVDRIKTDIDITQVLADYGYQVNTGGGDREQQFSCDLHGSGHDNKPSARVYPGSASWYCFGCDATRDAIETVRAKEGIEFKDALSFLEQKYGLPQLPWEDDERARTPQPSTASEVSATLARGGSFAEDLKQLHGTLSWVTQDREVPMDSLLSLWEASDAVAYLVGEGQATEEKGRLALAKITVKLQNLLFGEPS